jgi:hypothetical protein
VSWLQSNRSPAGLFLESYAEVGMNLKTKLTQADVVVGILCAVFLLGILGMIDSQGQERVKRIVCAYQVREQVQGLVNYANDHADRLPQRPATGHWLWDLDSRLVNDLLDRGLRKESFYCPSNVTAQKYMDRYWDFTAMWNGSRFLGGGYIVTNYGYVLQAQGTSREAITGSGNKKWLTSAKISDASSRELIVDGTISMPEPTAVTGRKFGDIAGGMYNLSAIYERTNHLRDLEHPWGGTIGFLDGHAGWRPFEGMELRDTDRLRYTDPPSFWW